jgi:hypothetical protein
LVLESEPLAHSLFVSPRDHDIFPASEFGKFSIKKKALRRGRNSATIEDLIPDARTVFAFRCSRVLRDRINAGGQTEQIF